MSVVVLAVALLDNNLGMVDLVGEPQALLPLAQVGDFVATAVKDISSPLTRAAFVALVEPLACAAP